MTQRPRPTAEAQLERILYILPAAARDDGIPIEELAGALQVDAATVLRDLEDATTRSFYHPAGTVDSFSILTDGRTVEVHAPHEFRRPVRLNEREALALGLGLRTLAADAEPARRAGILALATRLEAELTVPDVFAPRAPGTRPDAAPPAAAIAEPELEYAELAVVMDDDGFRGVIADAIEQQRQCAIWYLKPGENAPAQRTIAPYRLVYAYGRWYVAALDIERNALRSFRLDRVLEATIEDTPAPAAPAGLEQLLRAGVPYSAADEVHVSVRYSPRVARWVVERSTDAQLEQDGSAVLCHRVADPHWIVRHVLQYGGEARVEEPEVARRWVGRVAARLASPADDRA